MPLGRSLRWPSLGRRLSSTARRAARRCLSRHPHMLSISAWYSLAIGLVKGGGTKQTKVCRDDFDTQTRR